MGGKQLEGFRIFGEGVYIEEGCVVEEGAEIYAPVYILGGSHICAGARIMPFSYLSSTHVGANTVVFSSTLISAHIGADCTVGPYAYMRGGATVGDGSRVGDFVEIKSSVLGKGCKAAHLSYIGDAEIGNEVNIGCGVVFCNYDGKVKHRCVVGDRAFIGANCNLIAPVTVGEGAFIAAGTTLTKDLENEDFCIGRQREKVINGGASGRYKNL